jgi:predicted amidohydrolase YtcJ
MSQTTVFAAKDIITMNPSRPRATHVAVRDGRILAAGDLDEMSGWGPYELNDDFAGHVLTPGFVEGHAHAMEGGIWDYTYVGFQDRWDPDGNRWPGVTSFDAVLARLKEAEARLPDGETPLFAWGLDPIYFDGGRMSVTHLDQVSKTRPVLVLHSNGHLLNVNSRILEMAGIDASTNIYGVLKDEAGKPTGELMEMAAKYMAYRQTGNPFFGGIRTPSLLSYAKSAVNCGVTTATDLYATFNDESLAAYEEASMTPGYALRLMPAMNTIEQPITEGLELMRKAMAMAMNNDRLHHRLCKVMTDGSIQGFTARLKWPGYFNGRPNGLWNMEPGQLAELILRYHEAGMHLHIHTNGDEASELMLDAIEAAQEAHYRPDHRHTLQHCQMADASQFRRMRKLGVCANLFANHVHYWGDQHAAITMGPDRARRMDACATALREGVALAIHSDAPVTPMAPLFTAWCAVNRLTESGAVLGPEERISVDDAIHAITLGAAYTLRMDHLIGSIEPGKYADFAVLEASPFDTAAQELRDIKVAGTISGGEFHAAATRQG